jgi:cell division protein FtsA
MVHQVQKSLLTQIIRARTEEILEMIWKRLQQSGMDRLVCQRVVLTGGCSQLPGIRDLASNIWGKSVRIGYPKGIVGSSDVVATPMFSTCGGLLKFALRDYISDENQLNRIHDNAPVLTRMMAWIRENF